MSEDVEQVRQEVRFALSQLRARNGMHEFETMTRTLARATVTRNLLPATGPVASGGDQGRDFETFPTQLPGQIQPVGQRLGIPDRAMVAFACTLQQDDVRGKIRRDVTTILTSGTGISHVVYYCEADLPVAHRHSLEEWARDEHQVTLIVFDGAAITEQLAENHTYWIAETYLHLPARLLPTPENRPGWYEEDLARWRSDTEPVDTMGRLIDLAGCLHYATYYRDGQADIAFWLDRLETALDEGWPALLRRRALYELIVAHVRGLGDVTVVDDRVAEYFDDALSATDGQHLADAALVLMYVIGAAGRGATSHSVHTLRAWNTGLQARAFELLELDPPPGARCVLLDTLGWLRLHPDGVAAEEAGAAYVIDEDLAALSAAERMEAFDAGEMVRIEVPLVDAAGALEAFHQLTAVMVDAPLFPVEMVGKVLNLYSASLVDLPHFDEVVEAVDARIATTNGDAAAANMALDRVQALVAADRLVPSLKHLHRARNGLFSGEARYELVEATLATSIAYRDLGLYMASKQYALAAAYLASDTNPGQHSVALSYAAYADYHQGSWCTAAHLNVAALVSHRLLAEQPMNFNEHGWLSGAFFELTQIRALARSVGEPYETHIENLLTVGGIGEAADELLEGAGGGAPVWFETIDPDEHIARAVDDLGRPPFNDTTAVRQVRFGCLGANWSVRFRNRYADVAVGERVAAALQVVLAALAEQDLGLLPMERTLFVTALPAGADLDVQDLQSTATDARLSVSLPAMGTVSQDTASDAARETLSVVTAAVMGVSTLDEQDLQALVIAALNDNLLDNLAFGVPYDTLWRDVTTEDDFDARPHTEEPLTSAINTIRPVHRQLETPTSAGPGYTHEHSVAEIQHRYDDLPPRMRPTLNALKDDAAFMEVLAELRADGWKDWQLLIAVHGVAKNARHRFTAPTSPAEARAMARRFKEPEPEGDPIAPDQFTSESLRSALLTTVGSSAQTWWHLHVRPEPLPAEAVLKLLRDRYGWACDDVDHDDPFASP